MARPAKPAVERFLPKVKVSKEGCHLWQSTIKRDGYGQFWFRGKSEKAHYAAHVLFVGEVPAGICVLHRCDVRNCVNPEHLFLGTKADNVRDMDQKGRRGTRAILTDAQRKRVKKLLSLGFSQQVVADRFGLNQTTISRIALNKTRYSHI